MCLGYSCPQLEVRISVGIRSRPGQCSKWNGMCHQVTAFTSKDLTKTTQGMFSELLFIQHVLRSSSVLHHHYNKHQHRTLLITSI